MFVRISPAGALDLRQQGGRDGLSRPFAFFFHTNDNKKLTLLRTEQAQR